MILKIGVVGCYDLNLYVRSVWQLGIDGGCKSWPAFSFSHEVWLHQSCYGYIVVSNEVFKKDTQRLPRCLPLQSPPAPHPIQRRRISILNTLLESRCTTSIIRDCTEVSLTFWFINSCPFCPFKVNFGTSNV